MDMPQQTTKRRTKAKPVGDINSKEVGSGARYNEGKTPLELIPLSIQARFYDNLKVSANLEVLSLLGEFQGRRSGVSDLYHALRIIIDNDLTQTAKVFDFGRAKYAEWNWAKGMMWSIPLGCAARHLTAMIKGEELDPDSGLPHSAHVACNIIMLITYVTTYPQGDDRPDYLLNFDVAY